MRHLKQLIGFCILGITASCSSGDQTATPADVAQWDRELPIAAPWLRDQLPQGIRGYVRIPHPLGILATPKGNVFDAALRSEINVQNLLDIQQGLADNVFGSIEIIQQTGLGSLLAALRSPIEIAAFGPPNPSALIAMTLDVDSDATFEALIADMSAVDPSAAFSVVLDADGVGQISGLPIPIFVRFDEETGEALLHGAALATAESFSQITELLQPGTSHPMQASEQLIDASGQGLFAWIDMTAVLPLAQAFSPPDTASMINDMGLDAIRAMALGSGVANGKGRLTWLVDMGANDPDRLIPVVSNSFEATTVGAPAGIVALSIPSAEEFSRIERLILATLPQEQHNLWTDAKTQASEEIGVTLEDLLGAIGPELVGIFDAAGDYAALRLRDAALFDEIIAAVSARTGGTPEQQQVSGTTIYSWEFESAGIAAELGPSLAMGELGELLSRSRERFYWTREDGYLYVSSIPQPLIDRARLGATTNLADWLSTAQRIDASSSFLAATGSFPKVPRRLYYFYIEMMQDIADFAGANFDAMAMPTASQLGLPDDGVLGFAVNFGEPYVSMELTFESNPAEILLGGGGATSVAIVGILAAIAIPAYQDYTVRANVSMGLNEAFETRQLVEEFYRTSGDFPNSETSLKFDRYDVGGIVESITLESGTGVVMINFLPGGATDSGQVWLEPGVNADGSFVWACSGSIPTQYLPSACR